MRKSLLRKSRGQLLDHSGIFRIGRSFRVTGAAPLSRASPLRDAWEVGLCHGRTQGVRPPRSTPWQRRGQCLLVSNRKRRTVVG
jgi:hypothetical protein